MRYIFWRVIIIIAIIGLLAFGVFWGARKVIDLDRNRNGMLADATVVQRGFTPLGQWGKRDTDTSITSREVIVVGAQEVRVIKNTAFFQQGDIVIRDRGKLIFTNSVLEMTAGDKPRANIFVRDKGEIIFESATLKPHADDPSNLYVNLSDEARFVFNDSQGLHMLIAQDNAVIEMTGSTWAISLPNFRGGGVQVRDEVQARITNSTIGGLIIELSPDAQVDIKDFRAGMLEDFDLARDFSPRGVGFNFVVQHSEILSDYLEGGSERGLAIFAPSNVRRLRVSDSTLNKLVITSANERLAFEGLDIGVERNFTLRNINLASSKVMAQWGFFLHGGQARFTDSKGLWFFIHDDAELALVDSEMNEFDPRDFRGIIDFENVIWKNEGEIIHDNDFVWKGEWVAQGFAADDFHPLTWDSSKVTREFSVDIYEYDTAVVSSSAARVEVVGPDGAVLSQVYADKNGRAYFSVMFDDTNYKEKFTLKVARADKEIKHQIHFLTPTPIKLLLK